MANIISRGFGVLQRVITRGFFSSEPVVTPSAISVVKTKLVDGNDSIACSISNRLFAVNCTITSLDTVKTKLIDRPEAIELETNNTLTAIEVNIK